MFTRDKILTGLLLSSVLSSASSFAGINGLDQDRSFRRGHGGYFGNERSERPGRFVPGRLQHGGNGCPEGTMRVVFAPDNLSFTLLFDNFSADASSTENGQRGVMSCDAVLPITIPAGQQMEITRVDYRGFVSVPAGGRGMLASMFNFIEPYQQSGPGFGGGRPGYGQGRFNWKDRDRINIRYQFEGPLTQNYEISTGSMNDGRGLLQTEVSPCGGEAQLRIRNTVRVMAPQGQQAQLTVDSIDGSSNAVYYVNWRSCQPRPVAPPMPPPQPGRGCGRFGCAPNQPQQPMPGYSGQGGVFAPAVFDANFYLLNHRDLLAAFGAGNVNAAINHWVTYGINEGRQGSPAFSVRAYLARYPDVANAVGPNNYLGAIQHYLNFGIREGRNGAP